ncbi:hypothetical protein BG011_002389 [Mortierella polycephala]|uniref:Uncharacterized protein n=1 Tax=Mortierella polycephala TaxID=41804 RepID=A0A9P6PH98_9FUNG|nr:hypothetical protein BG011_002389 [Mortierella polycephala]
MTLEMPATSKTPQIMIVGAGLGEHMMGLLLEKINIPYQIFERSTPSRLDQMLCQSLKQLGLLEELKKISLPRPSLNLFHPDMKAIESIAMKGQKQA